MSYLCIVIPSPHGEAFPRLHLQAEGEKTAGSPPQSMEAEKKTRNTPEKPYCRAPRRAGAEGRETGKTPLSTMLNYSIVMRSINSNLLNINQAKSRINAAKAAGQTPAQEDVELVATEKKRAFAVAQYTEVMNIERFARHIATHGSVYSRADISAILYMAVDCLRELLLEGKKIRLGDLGDFYVTISSKGADSADKFTSQLITAVNVVWEGGSPFKNLLSDAEFNLVPSRGAQAALLKAVKAGQDTGEDTTDPGTTPEGSGGSDPGTNSGSGDTGSGSDTGGSGDSDSGPSFT